MGKNKINADGLNHFIQNLQNEDQKERIDPGTVEKALVAKSLRSKVGSRPVASLVDRESRIKVKMGNQTKIEQTPEMPLDEFLKNEKARYKKIKNDAIAVAALTTEEKQNLQDRLYRMIDYAIGRHDWYNNQRNLFMQIGIGLLAASATIAAVLAQLKTSLFGLTEVFAWLATLSVFFTGTTLLYIFNAGVGRDHPYRRIVDIKSWYFIYTFSTGLSGQISSKPQKAKKQVAEVVDGKAAFLTRWMELAKEDYGTLKEDMEQVFILQMLQCYIAQQLKQMSKTLYYGLVIAFVLFIVSSFSYSLQQFNSKPQPHGSTNTNNAEKVNTGSDQQRHVTPNSKRNQPLSIDSLPVDEEPKQTPPTIKKKKGEEEAEGAEKAKRVNDEPK